MAVRLRTMVFSGFNCGDYVWTWFDTGAMGVNRLYGQVVAAGLQTYTVKWESGIRNRLRQGDKRVFAVPLDELKTAQCALGQKFGGAK